MSRDLKEGRGSHVGNWGKSIPGRGNSRCKGPEVGLCLVYLRSCKEAMWLQCSASGVEGWEMKGEEGLEVTELGGGTPAI